jgi:hypothetical protein
LTMNEYGQFVSADDREDLQAWQFGQIIPLMLLLGPFMDVIRSFIPEKKEKKEKKGGERAGSSESPESVVDEKLSAGDTDVESIMPKFVMPVIKEVHVEDTDRIEEIKEVGSKGEVKEEVEEKESVREETSEEEPKEEGKA